MILMCIAMLTSSAAPGADDEPPDISPFGDEDISQFKDTSHTDDATPQLQQPGISAAEEMDCGNKCDTIFGHENSKLAFTLISTD